MMNRKKILIKKYENRRLYDTTNSRYVNLDEVARILQDGYEVEVVDAATGEDITRLILTQIIVEKAKAPDSPFPLATLRQMVIASARTGHENAQKFMQGMFDVYQNAYRAIPEAFSPFDLMRSTMEQATHTPKSEPVVPPPSAKERQNEARTGSDTDRSEVEELRRRLEHIESRLAQAGARRAKPKPRARKSAPRKNP